MHLGTTEMNTNIKLIGKYKNGNYTVAIFEDGTKIRYNELDYLDPDTIESFDFKITNMCDRGCRYCHENSTPDGKHGDIMNLKFIENLHPYTEIAVGGGNPLAHPQLLPFLRKCKDLKLIPSMTVNQYHFERCFSDIKELSDNKLIYGIGVSLVNVTDEFINKAKQIPNLVLHVINGIVTPEILKQLRYKRFKLLILGYKEVRRGEDYYASAFETVEVNKHAVSDLIPVLLNDNWFDVVSFDNLALQQLPVKENVSEDVWKSRYMGDDGFNGGFSSCSMFIDGVEGKFASNSCSKIRYDITDNIEEMYAILKKNVRGQ